jgi:hypothetical protein
MSRSHQALGVLIVVLFGLWGCSRAPSDQLTKKLIAAEEARTALTKQVEVLGRDGKVKDELLQARTAERDQVAGQFKALKDGLKELLAKTEGETRPDGSPAAPIIPVSHPKPEAPTSPVVPK